MNICERCGCIGQHKDWSECVASLRNKVAALEAELARVRAEREGLVAWKTLACTIHGNQRGEDLDAIVSRRL